MSSLKQYIPPILVDLKNQLLPSQYGWFGDFKSWEEASGRSSGYDSDKILEKVIHATQTVLKGEAEFERDSVLFYEKNYPFHVSTTLLWIASQNNLHLNVLDFGGALGSTYFQNQLFLSNLNVTWSIVEQENFVKAGKQYFQDTSLKFYHTIEESMAEQVPHIALLSSVLAYLPNPYELLEELFSYNIKYLVFDKHPLIEAYTDRLTVQNVPPDIYKASYPAWFFSSLKFYNFLASKYEVVYDFKTDIPNNIGAKFVCVVARLR